MKFVYPQGKRKALTFSYDDGQSHDIRLAELLRKHGMKGTFHLNSGKLGITFEHGSFVAPEEVQKVYEGHEVACHGVEHRDLPKISVHEALIELEEDRKALEKLTGGMVQGLSYAFGNYNEKVKDVVDSLGLKYSRTVNATGYFFTPADFLEWHPTCHHNDRLMELGEQFLNVAEFYELPVMYVWGHSFEFARNNDWEVIESFVEKMEGKDDIWYATNLEICDYVQATRRQEFSADGRMMHNPTAISIWVCTEEGLIEVKPGECKIVA